MYFFTLFGIIRASPHQFVRFSSPFVIQSVAKNLGNIHKYVYEDVLEILPPFGRLNDR